MNLLNGFKEEDLFNFVLMFVETNVTLKRIKEFKL